MKQRTALNDVDNAVQQWLRSSMMMMLPQSVKWSVGVCRNPKAAEEGRESGRRTDGLLQESERRKREREGEEGRGGRWSEVEVRCGGGGWSFHSIVQLPDRPDGGGFHQRSRVNRSLLRES